MKKALISLLAVLLGTAAFSQSEKYLSAMSEKISLLDSNGTVDSWKELGNSFERIADAEKTQWLPYYYAAYCHVMAGYSSLPMDGSFGDNSAVSDPFADKAETLLNKAEAMSKNNGEIYCVWKMIHSLRLVGNAMARYMTESGKVAEALDKAKSLTPDNPRVYILEGQDKFYTPEQFGGSKSEAKELFEKAQSLFDTYKPASSVSPNWGRATVGYFLAQYK